MDFALPELGEGLYEAELVRWLVKPGDAVKRGQPLLEVMTDKATMEVPAPFAGKITALKAEPGQTLQIGQPVLSYGDAAKPEPEPAAVTAPATTPAKPTTARARADRPRSSNGAPGAVPVKAAPSVRWMARKLGIDLATVHGSGPDGRVLVED